MELFIKGMSSKLQQLFVERVKDLENLYDKWDSIKNKDEHLVYVLLNAPGVGKRKIWIVIPHRFRCLHGSNSHLSPHTSPFPAHTPVWLKVAG